MYIFIHTLTHISIYTLIYTYTYRYMLDRVDSGSADAFVRDLLQCTERIAGASAAWQLRLIEHGLMERLLGVFLMQVPKP